MKTSINIKKESIENMFNFKYLNIIKDSYFKEYSGNSFISFNSINGLVYLIYANKKNNIITYDLINDKTVNEICNPHENKKITNFKYLFDKKNNRDLIMTVSSPSDNIKIWNIFDYICIFNIYSEELNIKDGCFLYDKDQIYIVVVDSCNWEESPIKVLDFNQKIIKEFDIKNSSDDKIYFIDTHYDNKLNKNFIIAGGRNKCTSYDFDENKIYNIYKDQKLSKSERDYDFEEFHCLVINQKDEMTNLIGLIDIYVSIWNFHTGELLNKIDFGNVLVVPLCLWNNNYLIVGYSHDDSMKVIDLNEKKLVKKIKNEDYYDNRHIKCIQKINLPKYGECLLTKGDKEGSLIKLWYIKHK